MIHCSDINIIAKSDDVQLFCKLSDVKGLFFNTEQFNGEITVLYSQGSLAYELPVMKNQDEVDLSSLCCFSDADDICINIPAQYQQKGELTVRIAFSGTFIVSGRAVRLRNFSSSDMKLINFV